MASSHVNPEDAVKIMLDLEADYAFGMHWGTFVLTDEDTLEPQKDFKLQQIITITLISNH